MTDINAETLRSYGIPVSSADISFLEDLLVSEQPSWADHYFADDPNTAHQIVLAGEEPEGF